MAAAMPPGELTPILLCSPHVLGHVLDGTLAAHLSCACGNVNLAAYRRLHISNKAGTYGNSTSRPCGASISRV